MSDQETSETSAQRGSRIDPYKHLVGVLTDSEVAAKAGVSSSAVHQYRNRLGIAPALPQGTTRRAMDRRQAREASGQPVTRRGKVLLTDKAADDVISLHVDQLGRAPDRTVAAQIGVVTESVQRFREKLGIAAFPEPPAEPSSPRSKRSKSRKGRSKLDPYRDMVGVLSDSEVAKQAGVTRSAVQMYRRTHGIPAASPPGGVRTTPAGAPELLAGGAGSMAASPEPGRAASRPASARATPPSRAPAAGGSGRRYAWMVRFQTASGEQSRVVVAADAASASKAAGSVGEVIGVERLAEALG